MLMEDIPFSLKYAYISEALTHTTTEDVEEGRDLTPEAKV